MIVSENASAVVNQLFAVSVLALRSRSLQSVAPSAASVPGPAPLVVVRPAVPSAL